MPCPTRIVELVIDRKPNRLAPAGGCYIRLSCGHQRWLAGVRRPNAPEITGCTESPCYKPDVRCFDL